MPSDGNSGKIPGASLLQGSQAAVKYNRPTGGKALPPGGKGATESAAREQPKTPTDAVKPATESSKPATEPSKPVAATGATTRATDPQSLVNLLNSHLNDSGRPDQFRLDPSSAGRLIQQVNPSNGAVIGEYSIDEFPALARSIGASGLLVDSVA